MKTHPGVAGRTFATLAELGTEPEIVSTSPIKIACFVDRDRGRTRCARCTTPSSWTPRRQFVPTTDARIGRRRHGRRRDRLARAARRARVLRRPGVRVVPVGRLDVGYGGGWLPVEEATPERLAGDGLDLCFFSVGTGPSWSSFRRRRGGTTCIDKSGRLPARRGYPAHRRRRERRRDRRRADRGEPELFRDPAIVCPEAAPRRSGLRRCGLRPTSRCSSRDAGVERMGRRADAGRPRDGLGPFGAEFDEESKLRDETRKILGLPDLPIQAACIRIPVLVGHGQAIWVETEERLSPDQARSLLGSAPHVALEEAPHAGLGRRAGTRCCSAASGRARSRTSSRSGQSTTTSARARR